MTIPQQLEKIANWTQQNYIHPSNQLNPSTNERLFAEIEALLEESIPPAFKTLYAAYNGEVGEETGALLGLRFMTLEEIILDLQFARTMIKPQGNTIVETERTETLRLEIIGYMVNLIPENTTWHKLEFSCSPSSLGGPYLYETEGEERSTLAVGEIANQVYKACQEWHESEKDLMNWDDLQFEIWSNGEFKLERVETDWKSLLNLAAFPANAVQLKYFHFKWLPIFTDGGGNFLGIDLDPAEAGKKGQIIIYGRDETVLPVLADSLSAFFDLCLQHIEKKPEIFLTDNHIHEIFKQLVGAPYELLE